MNSKRQPLVMRTFILATIVLLIGFALIGCPPKAKKVIGTHQELSFSADETTISFYPNPNKWPTSATLTVTVQTYIDYNDGTSSPGALVQGATVVLSSDDPTPKCATLSKTSITTNASGSAKATITALPVKADCTVRITAAYTTSGLTPGKVEKEIVDILVKTS